MKPDDALASARGLPALGDCADPEYLAWLAHPDTPSPRDPDALVPFALKVALRTKPAHLALDLGRHALS